MAALSLFQQTRKLKTANWAKKVHSQFPQNFLAASQKIFFLSLMNTKELEFRGLGTSMSMIKTEGGHYVIPMVEFIEVTTVNHADIKSEEAEAVMTILFASADSKEELENIHNEVGHAKFNTNVLNDDEKNQIIKADKYFGHRSGRKIWELFAKSVRLRGKKQAALDIIDKCKVCSLYKKSPPRP